MLSLTAPDNLASRHQVGNFDEQPWGLLASAIRVEDLLSRLIPEEKAGQLTQYLFLDLGEASNDVDLDSGCPGSPDG